MIGLDGGDYDVFVADDDEDDKDRGAVQRGASMGGERSA